MCNVLPSAGLILVHTAPQTHASRILPNLASSFTSKVAPKAKALEKDTKQTDQLL